MNPAGLQIDQFTRAYGVVGYPLGHTLSPVLHNAAFRLTGQNAAYLAFETRDLEGCIKGARALGLGGLSVTLPYKSAVLTLLDEIDPLAERVGAVNTVLNEGGRLKGFNTDAAGALLALEEKVSLKGKRCLMVGAGGAARAVGFALIGRGATLCLSNRSPERGRALAKDLGCAFVEWREMESAAADLLVQTTPVGMHPGEDRCSVPEALLREGMTVMDIVYNPVETRLIRAARERGCETVTGLSMFVRQGAEQFRLWTGVDPPLQAMTEAVEGALEEGREK